MRVLGEGLGGVVGGSHLLRAASVQTPAPSVRPSVCQGLVQSGITCVLSWSLSGWVPSFSPKSMGGWGVLYNWICWHSQCLYF